MGLTTERKVFLGLVGIAGLALFIDQGFLGPKEASADVFPVAIEPAADIAPSITDSPVTQQAASAILIDRLKGSVSSDMDGTLGSAFSLTKLIETETTEQISALEDQGSTSSDAFPMIAPKAVDLPALTAVMPSKTGGGAVIGGKLLRVGQTGPGGYRLVTVMARAVLVEKDGEQYAIEMPTNIGKP